jgi:5'-methylthioadenosine phosphorylase
MAHPVCPRLSGALTLAAREERIDHSEGGTYICMEGPQFSTRAESFLYRAWDCSVIGMTAMPEAKLAREAELPYAIVAMVTDYDCWHEAHEAVTVEMVVANLTKNSKTAQEIIRRATAALDPTADCTCRHALATAIMTPNQLLRPVTRKKLGLLLKKYSQKK